MNFPKFGDYVGIIFIKFIINISTLSVYGFSDNGDILSYFIKYELSPKTFFNSSKLVTPVPPLDADNTPERLFKLWL